MRTGLFGGTFNPVHLGHLVAAAQAMEAFELDQVHFIPNKIPPHRRLEGINDRSEHRFAMLTLATASNPHFFVSRCELERNSTSYTVDTVRELREDHPDWQLFFITGADAITGPAWKDFDRLLEMLQAFVVLARPGSNMEALQERLEVLTDAERSVIKLLHVPLLDLSSTQVRSLCRQRHAIRYLVPPGVDTYIQKYGLYTPSLTLPDPATQDQVPIQPNVEAS